MISSYSVKKPFTIFVAVILIILLGFISFSNMTTDLLPKMDFPYAIIMTTYIGESPEKIETVITKPLEQSMATLSNIKNISSVSSENSSMVILEFSNDVNMDSILIELNGKLDLIKASWTDTNIGAPIVTKINPNMLPVMVAAVDVKDMNSNQIKEFVNNSVLPNLEKVEGVASVTTQGEIEEKIKVNLNQDKINKINTKLLNSVSSKLSKTQGELNKAKKQLEDGKQEYSNQSNEQMKKLTDGLKVIKIGISKIDSTQNELNSKEQGLLLANNTLSTTIKGMDTLLIELINQRTQLEKLGDKITQEQKQQLDTIKTSIKKTEQLKKETILKQEESEKGLNQITEGKKQLAVQRNELQNKESDLENTKLVLTTELSKASLKLSSSEEQLNKGIKEFEVAREQALKNASIDGIITQEMISNILIANNFSMPAGYIGNQDTDKMLIKVGEKFDNLDEIKNLKLLSFDISGLENITLQDLADVEYTDNSNEIYAKVNGNNSVILTFQKQSTYSTSNICKDIEKAMNKMQNENSNIRFTNLMDQGVYIDMIIGNVLENLFYGAILAVIILFIFLRDYKPTIVIALSIPISLTFAIALMYFTGVTINIISLSGLALGVGMLVDNSIVVIENIYRLKNNGNSVRESAIQGASRVAAAIASSTLTTVCVFLPIVFIQGISRQLFTDMGLTIAYSLLASLIVALTLVPAMASKMFNKTKQQKEEAKWFKTIIGFYERTLNVVLKHKIIFILMIIILLITSVLLARSMGTAFIPEVEGQQISITMTSPKEATLEDVKNTSNKVIDKLLNEIKDIDTIGAMDSTSDNSARKTVSLYAILKENKDLDNKEIEKKIYELTKDLNYEIKVSTSNMDLSAMTSSGIQIVVKGKEINKLQEIAKDIESLIKSVDGIEKVDNGIQDTQKETKVIVDKSKAMEYGLTVAQVYQEIAKKVQNETKSTTITIDDKDYPVIVAKQNDKKVTKDNLDNIKLIGKKNNENVEVELLQIATIQEEDGLLSISHDNQERYISVTATIKVDSNVGLVGRDIQEKLKEYKALEGYSVELEGESETINQSLKDLALMIGLAIIFIYLIMVAQFQSLKSPFIVMFTIPLAFTGGILALFITGSEISLIAMLGFLMLAGIVVNNGIVFIDYANTLIREEKKKVKDALIETGKIRLKPILMTALTTILGLSTMALGIGSGSEMVKPIGIVTIGGLLYSTILTLYLVPCLYLVFNKEKCKTKEIKNKEKEYKKQTINNKK